MRYENSMESLTLESVLSLYDSVEWTTYTENPESLMRAISNATFVTSCFAGESLVGLARSVSDDVAIHYLQDILVHPQYQRQGIGRELFGRCMERFTHVRTHVLLTDDEKKQHEFYRSLGFENTVQFSKFPLNCFVKMVG